MSASNTSILIKRSTGTSAPSTLKAGELGYSYLSNTAFIGTAGGDGVIKIGGQYYTDLLDNRSWNTVANTIVERDENGNIYGNYIVGNVVGNIDGTSNNALYLSEPQYFGIQGGDVFANKILFNGRNQISLDASLNTVPGLVAGTYGSTTAVPVVEVAANGRVMSISTQSISTQFDVAGDSGTTTIEGGETFYMVGGKGITSTATANTVTFDVDNTVLRSNTNLGTQVFLGDLSITGNVLLNGNTFTVDVSTLNVADPIIYLAANNYTSDVVDIGFAGNYYDGSDQRHFGMVRHASNKNVYVFDEYMPEPGQVIDVNDSSFHLATVYANINAPLITATQANITTANVTTINATTGTLTIDGAVHGSSFLADEGAGATGGYGFYQDGAQDTGMYSPADGELAFYANATESFTANSAGVFVPTSLTSQSLTLNSALTVPNGGTGVTSFTSGQIVIGNGTNALQQLANTNTAGTYGNANTVPVVTTDVWGRVSSVTNTAIAITAAQITSGTLGYSRGGTGSSSYSTGQLLVAGGSGFLSLANTTYTQTGTLAANNTLTGITVDAYGRFTAATVSAISGLQVDQGGTGASSFTLDGIVYGNGSGALQATAAAGTSDQTFSNQILTVTNAGVPVWTTTLDGGTF
jgi:hypothetical protein